MKHLQDKMDKRGKTEFKQSNFGSIVVRKKRIGNGLSEAARHGRRAPAFAAEPQRPDGANPLLILLKF